MREVTTLAHQLSTQVRVGGKTIPAMQPKVVIDQQKLTNGIGYRKNARIGF